jgi:sodium-dependent dicarboxylate transporter 2/3/5
VVPDAEPDVRPMRLLVAVAVGVLSWWAADLLPFAADANRTAGAVVLGVTAATIACWMTAAMPLGAASLLPAVLLPMFGAVSMPELVRGYSDPILWLFGGGFVLAQAIERWGLHRRLALHVVRLVGPHPRRLVAGFFLVATSISFWINNTSVALMLLPIGSAIVDRAHVGKQLSERHAANFGAGIMLAIAYGASIGGMGTPIGTAPNLVFFLNYQPLVERGAPPISFLQWMLAFAPFALLLTAIFTWCLTRFVLPLPSGPLTGGEAIVAKARAQGPMTTPERRVAWLFSAAVLLWITRGDVRLSSETVVHGWAHYLRPTGSKDDFLPDGLVAILVAIAAFVIPSGAARHEPRYLMNWATAQKLPFDILFLLGAGIALARAFEPTGVSRAFGDLLQPLIGSTPPLLLVTVVCIAILLLSEIASNTAIASLFLPILAQGAIAADLDPRILMLPAALAASCGFMLPIATPPNTIVFASGHVRMGQMARAGFVLDVLSIVLLIAMLWLWVFPILGIDPSARPAWLPPK